MLDRTLRGHTWRPLPNLRYCLCAVAVVVMSLCMS